SVPDRQAPTGILAAPGRRRHNYCRPTPGSVQEQDAMPDMLSVCPTAISPETPERIGTAARPTEKRTLLGHADWVSCVAFSRDGQQLVSAGRDRAVILWNPASEREIGRLGGHQAAVHAVAFSPDDEALASSDDDGSIRLWDTACRAEFRCLNGHD